jgi:hypothetical protein
MSFRIGVSSVGIATGWKKTLLEYCCVRVLPSNGCFYGSTVLAWSKYMYTTVLLAFTE